MEEKVKATEHFVPLGSLIEILHNFFEEIWVDVFLGFCLSDDKVAFLSLPGGVFFFFGGDGPIFWIIVVIKVFFEMEEEVIENFQFSVGAVWLIEGEVYALKIHFVDLSLALLFVNLEIG